MSATNLVDSVDRSPAPFLGTASLGGCFYAAAAV